MAIASARIIEATYENGLLRPLEPIQDSDNQIYFVTILNRDTLGSKVRSPEPGNLRGRYRGYLSSADEFALGKQIEKAVEL